MTTSPKSTDRQSPINQLLGIMAALRDPEHGCPWDVRQDFASIVPYTIEEAYEVADAIERGDMDDLCDELGDLLLQVVFHAQMAKERGLFDFNDVARAICAKMIRRHPHVFGNASERGKSPEKGFWEDIKDAERNEKPARNSSLLDDVPKGLPALIRGQKLQKKAARAGFDWPDYHGVIAKLREELDELETAISSGDKKETSAEMGDVLFSAVNLARHLDIDSETAMRDANYKFSSRFKAMEELAKAENKSFPAADAEQKNRWWEAVKRETEK